MKKMSYVAAMALAVASFSVHADDAAAPVAPEKTVAPAVEAQKPAKGDELTPYTGKLPPVLESLSKVGAGLTVVKSFDAAGALDGWVVRDGESGKYVVVYTAGDDVMVAGLVLDKNGENLTGIYSEQHLPQPDYTAALEDFNTNSSNVVLGSDSAKAEITVAYDVNCGFCKIMHKLVKPAVDAGELRVRLVPVAILGSDSGPKGAGLLAAPDLAEALNASTYGMGKVAMSSDPAMLAKVQSNTELMRKHGFNGTPAVLYSVTKGDESTVYVANGVPNVPEMFTRLGISQDHLKPAKDDPALARFVQ